MAKSRAEYIREHLQDEDEAIFDLVDEATVEKLKREGKIDLPYKEIDIPKDQRWNEKQMASKLLHSIENGDSIPKLAQSLTEVIGNNMNSAIRNARTMTTAAENGGRLDSYKNLDAQGVVQKKVWSATADDRTRPSHIDIDGEEQDIDVSFSNGCMFPADGKGPAEEVWMCFTPETSVAVDSDILKSYKHWYDGDLVKIKTSNGVYLTCTPNHPILSGRGWVKANTLHNGDNLLVTFARNNSFFITGGNPNIKHIFTRMDTLHKAFDVFFGKRVSNLTMNFHGDISTSNVEVVSQERLLGIGWNIGVVKCLYKFIFKLAYTLMSCEGYFTKCFLRGCFSTGGIMRGICDSLSFFGGGLSHACKHSFGTIAGADSILRKVANDNGTADTEFFCKSLDGLLGKVFFDKIIDIQIDSFHGFVYNLQTDNNYYFVNNIIAEKGENNNGIYAIAHNCRCSMGVHIVGFRRSDGSISRVKSGLDNTMHQRQITEEKERRKHVNKD